MPEGQQTRNYASLAALAVVATQFSNAWGAAWSKSLFAAIGPEGVIALRVGFSAILLGVVTRAWRLRVRRNQVGNVVAYGIALGLMNSIAYQAYARIPIGIGMAIEVTGPLAVVIFNSRRPADLAWVACTIAGLVLLLFKGIGDVAAVDPIGIAFAFGSAACWASYIVFGKRVSALGGGSIAAAGLAVAFVFVVPFGLATTGTKLFREEWLISGLVIAILCSAIPFFLQIHAMRQLPSRVYGLLASAVPAVGAIMAYIVLSEALDLQQCLGILLVIVAGAGATLGLTRQRSGA